MLFDQRVTLVFQPDESRCNFINDKMLYSLTTILFYSSSDSLDDNFLQLKFTSSCVNESHQTTGLDDSAFFAPGSAIIADLNSRRFLHFQTFQFHPQRSHPNTQRGGRLLAMPVIFLQCLFNILPLDVRQLNRI